MGRSRIKRTLVLLLFVVAAGVSGCSSDSERGGSLQSLPYTATTDDVGGMADALGGAPDAGISTSSSDTDKERGERPDVDSAPVLSILKNEEDLPPRVSSCLAARVPAEPELAAEVINGSAEARVSLIRGCERVGSLVDGWLGSADKQCLEAVLSRASSLELDKMMSFLMNPDAGDIDSMSLTAQVEECRN